MIKDWNEKNNKDYLPKFNIAIPKQKIEIVVNMDTATENMSPILAEWFLKKSPAQRELIVLDAYAKEKMEELDKRLGELNDEL